MLYLRHKIIFISPALLPAMQETQGNMDGVLSRNDLCDDEKAKRYFPLHSRYLVFEEQSNTRTPATNRYDSISCYCIRAQVNKIPAQKKAKNIPTMLLLPVSVLV